MGIVFGREVEHAHETPPESPLVLDENREGLMASTLASREKHPRIDSKKDLQE